MDDRIGQIMFMTAEERELRINLRLKLEEIANKNKLFDNHGNEIKAIHITDVMRLILEEDVEILELQHKIKQLTKIRTEITVEDLENALANDPKGSTEVNQQIVDFVKDKNAPGINVFEILTDNVPIIRPEAFSKCSGLGVSSVICHQSLEDISFINIDEADRIIGPDDKTEEAYKEAYKNRDILKRDV